MRGIFVTGTDTGVGKTYVGALIIQALTARGIAVTPRKPVESGCERNHDGLFPADAEALHGAAGQTGGLENVCPYRFEQPVSPARAAQLQGIHLTIADLEQACLRGADSSNFVWVEGAGGFYSPLAADGLNADLAARLGLPVLLIAADRLGCINHVLLTVDAVRARGLALIAVVLNRTTTDKSPEMDNAEDLQGLLTCPLFSTAGPAANDSPRSQFAALIDVVADA